VRIVEDLAQHGIGVIIMSTEPETVLAMANRVLIMRTGRLTHELSNRSIAKDDWDDPKQRVQLPVPDWYRRRCQVRGEASHAA